MGSGERRVVGQGDGDDPVEAELIEVAAERAARLVATRIETLEVFTGPLPSPDILARYDVVVPGAAERIISRFERQTSHRHDLEDRHLQGNQDSEKRGQWMAFVITLVFLSAGSGLVLAGHPWPGFGVMGLDLVALVTVFITGRRAQERERQSKREELRNPQSADDPGEQQSDTGRLKPPNRGA